MPVHLGSQINEKRSSPLVAMAFRAGVRKAASAPCLAAKTCANRVPRVPAQAWAEYLWVRLRRMDYWNPKYTTDGLLTNAPAKMYRWNAPGLREGRPKAVMNNHDEKLGTNVFSVRYYQRDRKPFPSKSDSPLCRATFLPRCSLCEPCSRPSVARPPPRAEIKRDTGYYADTPLSTNHAIMQGSPLRPAYKPQPDNAADHNCSGGSFGSASGTGAKFGNLALIGIKKVNYPEVSKPDPMF